MAIDVEKIGRNREEDADGRRKRWTSEEYHRLAEIGLFDLGINQERVELIDGDIYRKHPAAEEEHLRRWTVNEYYEIYEAGLLDGQRAELIDGEILLMSPMAAPHAICVMKTQYALIDALPRRLIVRVQLPLRMFNRTEPEPDLAIIERSVAFDLSQNPSTAELVIEVSDSTLKADRTTKMSLYAAANIPEYWILDLQNRRLEVHRQPIEDDLQPFARRYGMMQTLNAEGEIGPLCAPDVVVKVADLLP
jgi:Uma2 family endonuclease